jgi:hypothetical protein
VPRENDVRGLGIKILKMGLIVPKPSTADRLQRIIQRTFHQGAVRKRLLRGRNKRSRGRLSVHLVQSAERGGNRTRRQRAQRAAGSRECDGRGHPLRRLSRPGHVRGDGVQRAARSARFIRSPSSHREVDQHVWRAEQDPALAGWPEPRARHTGRPARPEGGRPAIESYLRATSYCPENPRNFDQAPRPERELPA